MLRKEGEVDASKCEHSECTIVIVSSSQLDPRRRGHIPRQCIVLRWRRTLSLKMTTLGEPKNKFLNVSKYKD